MNNRMKNNRNSGFTLVETLVTVAIIVILLGISAVAIVRYINRLKLTELDNAAREIYMAAENRAVLLSGNQRLNNMVKESGVHVELGDPHSGASNDDLLDGGTENGDEAAENLYYVYADKAVECGLLDTGNIDPTLLEGDFYIVYDLVSGSVTDVVYAGKKGSLSGNLAGDEDNENDIGKETFENKYDELWAKDFSDRVTKKPLVGWYYGEASEGSAQMVSPDGQPVLNVEIKNEEELTVKVSVYYGENNKVTDDDVREAVRDAIENAGKDNGLSVWLSKGGVDKTSEGIELTDNKYDYLIIEEAYDTGANATSNSYSCTWMLDSLTREKNGKELKFKNLDITEQTGVNPGDDFRVTATIPSNVSKGLRERTDYEDDNSLFESIKTDEENGAATAYIGCLRHLQNLDQKGGYASGVMDGITRAVQTDNIFGEGNEYDEGGKDRIYKEYEFDSIYNENLESYNGYNLDSSDDTTNDITNDAADDDTTDGTTDDAELNGYEIQNLVVKTNNLGVVSFGLFRQTRNDGMTFRNIRLVNTVVQASGTNASVGALAGTVTGTTVIKNCWVYWEAGEGVDSLQEELGTDENGISGYKYQLKGSNVGGLIGTWKTGGTAAAINIENCLAASMIEGSSYAGGLVGEVQGSAGLTIERSYADCYLTRGGTSINARVAGLIGNVANNNVTLKNCYASGFVVGVKTKKSTTDDAKFNAAGLCLGNGAVKATNVYSVIRYLDDDGNNIDINSNRVYSKIYGLTQSGMVSGSDNYWFLGTTADGNTIQEIRSYDDMANSGASDIKENDFAYIMNENKKDGAFIWRPETHAYNLRTDLKLVRYSFPGLKDMTHYGDWGAKFKEPSLVYYEHYDTSTAAGSQEWGISGGNERNLLGVNNLKDSEETGKDTRTVLSDGYAVAFLKADVESANAGSVTIDYNYLNDDENGEKKSGSIIVSVDGLQQTKWEDADNPENAQAAYLIPLPEDLVYNSHAQNSFYHYIEFELYYDKEDNSEEPEDVEGADADGEYFFNPHFAEAIESYSGTTGHPENWDEDMTEAADKLAGSIGLISVRTPRHLYDLSLFKEYYNSQNRYSFRQYLELDYFIYKWLGMDRNGKNTGSSIFNLTEGKDSDPVVTNTGKLSAPYSQKPIGSQSAPFTGNYNGNYCIIKNVIPDLNVLQSDNQYAGLFGYFTGNRLENIVYQMGPEDADMDTVESLTDAAYAPYRLSVAKDDISNGMYIGGLAGFSNGTISNCAVYGVDVDVSISVISVYMGGLVGRNEGSVLSCSAESNALAANSSSYADIYAGGFVGNNARNGSISASYAVGRIDVEVESTTAERTRISGFAGTNSGTISDAYAAVDLKSSGGTVSAYGFSANDGSLNNVGYLDQGSYTYRKDSYNAKYQREDDGNAKSYTYAQLSGSDTDSTKNFTVSDSVMGPATNSPQNGTKETKYPFPAAVKNANDDYIHYGLWITRMNLGGMGVFYWEKMQDVEPGDDGMNTAVGEGTYHIYALSVDPEANGGGNITVNSTLSEAYDDGKAVTEYGYGYYSADKATVTFQGGNIYYYEYSDWNNTRRTRDQLKNSNAIMKLTNDSDEPQHYDPVVNNALETMIPGFKFFSWHSYHEGGRSPEWGNGVPNSDALRKAQSTAGLIPVLAEGKENGDALEPNDGTFTLTQNKEDIDELTVEFTVNTQFAASMSVKNADTLINGGWAIDTVIKEEPGISEKNPYQVRCGTQLQEINWLDTAYTDAAVGWTHRDNYEIWRYPYLCGIDTTNGEDDASNPDRHYWKQTHDMDWIAEGNFYYQFGNTYLARNDVENSPEQYSGAECLIGVFYPIAAAATRSGAYPLSGWFGGIYDGCNYNMKNFNIDLNFIDYDVNCMGLFGAVKNAELTNIVLYSEGGNDVVTVRGRKEYNQWWSWYAGGVLAGVAIDSTISNCAVAGYTVKDQTINIPNPQWNGDEGLNGIAGAVGGLVGMTNSDLTGCVAITTIELKENYNGGVYSHGSANGQYSPVRVGGLVGSTTGDVENCYTGGKIIVDSVNGQYALVYAGRIIGGVGIEPLSNDYNNSDGSNKVSVTNCYSYLTLPGAVPLIKNERQGNYTQLYVEVYDIGGTEHGEYRGYTVGLDNNYYLSSTDTEDGNTARGITYQQLTGEKNISVETEGNVQTTDIYQWLNGSATRDPYDKVTTTLGNVEGGLSVTGRYTYAPKTAAKLQGLDYPFPTILTREGNHVHYGEWTLYGIERYKNMSGSGEDAVFENELGGSPVELDLFTPEENQTETEAGLHLEYLKLTNDVKSGGTWKVKSSDASVVDASFINDWSDTNYKDEDGYVTLPDVYGYTELYMKAMKVTEIPVTVTVMYIEPDGTEYELKITVHASANVELEPSRLSMFPNDCVVVELVPGNENAEVVLKPDTAGSTNSHVTATVNREGNLELETDGLENMPADRTVYVDVDYEYTLENKTVEGTKRITVTLLQLPQVGEWVKEWVEEDEIWTWKWIIDLSDSEGAEIITGLKDDETDTPPGIGGVSIGDVVNENDYKITLTKSDEFNTNSVEKYIFATTQENQGIEGEEPVVLELEHRLKFIVPKPVTETDLTLSITQENQTGEDDTTYSSWIIDFGDYLVLNPDDVEAKDGSVMAALMESGSVMAAPMEDDSVTDAPMEDDSVITAFLEDIGVTTALLENDSVIATFQGDGAVALTLENGNTEFPNSVTLTVILTDRNSLWEKITLNVVLPKLTAEQGTKTGEEESETITYSWPIKLSGYSELVNSVNVEAPEGFEVVSSVDDSNTDTNTNNDTEIDTDTGTYTYILTYIAHAGEDGTIPMSAELTVTVETTDGLTEICTLIVMLPDPVAIDNSLDNGLTDDLIEEDILTNDSNAYNDPADDLNDDDDLTNDPDDDDDLTNDPDDDDDPTDDPNDDDDPADDPNDDDPPADDPNDDDDPPADDPNDDDDPPADDPNDDDDPPADDPDANNDPPANDPDANNDPPADDPNANNDPPADPNASNVPEALLMTVPGQGDPEPDDDDL